MKNRNENLWKDLCILLSCFNGALIVALIMAIGKIPYSPGSTTIPSSSTIPAMEDSLDRSIDRARAARIYMFPIIDSVRIPTVDTIPIKAIK